MSLSTIYLIGPSGVGKSSCGEYAARHLRDVRYFDLDRELSPLMEPSGRTRVSLAQDWAVVSDILNTLDTNGPTGNWFPSVLARRT